MSDIEYCKSSKCKIDLAKILDINPNVFTIPKSLFHFRGLKNESVKDIINNRISLTNPKMFNDIYDSFLHHDTSSKLANILNSINICFPNNKIHNAKELIHRNERIDDIKAEKMMETLRIACFSELYDDVKLWGLYADNNKGFAVEYNFQNRNDIIRDLIFPVFYRKAPLNLTELLESERVMLALLVSVISKSDAWQYEKEWRIVLPLAPAKPDNWLPVEKQPNPESVIFGKIVLLRN